MAITNNKRPIDKFRDSGGAFTVGSENDGTPITEMFPLDSGLLLITQKAIYEVKMADQIDPKRENPNIPHNVQRRILDLGTDSEFVGRTLLTAKALFKKEFLPSSIDIKRALVLTFEALTDLIAMDSVSKEYILAEQQEIEAAEKRICNNSSFVIPSVKDAKIRCKTFMQKADHVEQTMLDIIKLFYPNTSTKHFESVHESLKKKYSEDDDFAKFIEQALPFLKMIRNARDCLDHRNNKNIKVTDFEMLPDGKIALPMIEIKFRDTDQPATSASFFMTKAIESMLNVFEHLLAFLCSKHVQPFAGFPIELGAMPEDRRSNKFVQYGYWTNITGEWAPIG